MWRTLYRRSNILIAAATVLAVTLVTVSSSRLSAQEIQLSDEPSLWYEMAQGPESGQVQDLGNKANNGNLFGYPDPATAFGIDDDGSTFVSFDGNQHIWSGELTKAPTVFSLEVEFRTVTAGGKILGFEDKSTGFGTLSDRVLYIAADGTLRFGGASGISVTIGSANAVTDGLWHSAVAQVRIVNSQPLYMLFLDGVYQGQITGRSVSSYPGYWRIGNGNISGWEGAETNGFVGYIRLAKVFEGVEVAVQPTPTPEPAPTPQPTPVPQPTPAGFVEPDIPVEEFLDEEEFRRLGPRIDVSSDIDGDFLTLEISVRELELFDLLDTSVWVIREEDGEEFQVDFSGPEMTWQGEAATSRYRVEVRQDLIAETDGQQVLASGSVPVFFQPASGARVATAVVVTVAIAGTASAASASGTWIYELIWRFLRIIFAEKLRRRTKKLDISSIPSSVAAVSAMVIMALLIAVGRPGALGLNSIFTALAVTVPAVILFRLVTILGGYGLAYYTHQKPRYLIWGAGTVSFAITSIVLQSPVGYTGYMEREPTDRARDARFAGAGFTAILALSGLFVMIGLLTKMSFAETGVTLTLGVLAVAMLPFPLMGGHALWRWNRVAGVASGVIGMAPYILFQLGQLSPTGIVTIATAGMLAFGGFLVFELWLAEQEQMRRSVAAAEAAAEGASAV